MTKEVPQPLQAFFNSLNIEDVLGIWTFTVYSIYPAPTPASSATEELSDQLVCERLRAYIEASLRFNTEELYGENIPLQIEFIRLPSASTQDARKHCRAKYGWPEEHDKRILRELREHYGMRFDWIVMIDEESSSMIRVLSQDFRLARAIEMRQQEKTISR
ncbi:uncharacterized protein LY89DRAFT_736093 [Mollisia scopiformis]|uniref:Uncharacterized protein n=1 Tax=Mollisia scopiformis TaxID=149040 RepID=A0A194X4P1_MOLSC|nr:uncharacterized protein LY89DRAFT_736093 [Mollisia scopiformis]KUJ15034.1 hypothetical protein LY89DRAFT_736093 [Mollisia scopiformis]